MLCLLLRCLTTLQLLRDGNFQTFRLRLHRCNLTRPLTHNDVCTTAQDHAKTALVTHRRRTRNQRGKVLPIHMLDVRATGLELFKNLQMRAHVFEAIDEPILIDVQQFLKLVSVYHTTLDGLQVDGAMCAHFLHGNI